MAPPHPDTAARVNRRISDWRESLFPVSDAPGLAVQRRVGQMVPFHFSIESGGNARDTAARLRGFPSVSRPFITKLSSEGMETAQPIYKNKHTDGRWTVGLSNMFSMAARSFYDSCPAGVGTTCTVVLPRHPQLIPAPGSDATFFTLRSGQQNAAGVPRCGAHCAGRVAVGGGPAAFRPVVV